jgi:type I restriction enzyme S subunit
VTEDRDNLSELPPSWELTSLGNLFCWSNGKNLTKQKMEEGSYCVYGGNGIAGHHNQWLSEEQSIIVGRVGAQCGNVHLAPSHSWITDNAIYTSWKTNHIYLKFFYYLLGNFKLNELAGGSGQPYISQTILNPLLIPLPPLNEQRRIVAKIEALKARSQRVKEELEAIPALLDQFRQSVLAAAFRGDLTADWREKNPDVEPASVLLERIRVERRRRWEEAELEKMKAQGKTPKDEKWKSKYKEPPPPNPDYTFSLPPNWAWASLDSLCSHFVDCAHRTPKYSEEGYPALRPRDVVNGRLNIDAEREKLDTKKKAKGKTEKNSRKAKPEAAESEQLSLPGFE